MSIVLTQGGEVEISRHAIRRYIERVRPACSFVQAHTELRHLLPQADYVEAMPAWASFHPESDQTADGFLVLCDSIVFPVIDGCVPTALARGTFPPTVREARSGERKRRRQRNRATRISRNSGVVRRQRKAGKPRPHFGQEAA